METSLPTSQLLELDHKVSELKKTLQRSAINIWQVILPYYCQQISKAKERLWKVYAYLVEILIWFPDVKRHIVVKLKHCILDLTDEPEITRCSNVYIFTSQFP